MQNVLFFFFSLCVLTTSFAQSTDKAISNDRKITQDEIQSIISTLESNVANPAWVQSEEWLALRAELESPETLELSVESFRTSFNQKVNLEIYVVLSY